jgi:hypothetical protein
MNLQNGYKVIYEKAADGKRTFYASKTGVFADAEKILEATIGEYKLIYEKNGQFYGSTTGIPAEGDYCFVEFDKVFKEAAEEPVAPAAEEPVIEEPVTEEPDVEEPVVEENN